MQYKIFWSARIDKQLEKLPEFIRDKFHYWVDLIEMIGLLEVRKIRGFHDEPLYGNLRGLRSVRLNKAYRVIYNCRFEVEHIEILEINKHEYKK